MKFKNYMSLMLLSLSAMACGTKNQASAGDALAESGRTVKTENLLANLKQMPEQGFMFGHHDDPVYGIGWVGDANRSDVKSVCGDYPAVMSFDLGHLELGDSVNLDGVPFNRIRQEAIEQYNRGGVVSFSWHPDNPVTKGDAWDVSDSTVVASILAGGSQHEKFLGWLDKVADYMNSIQTADGVKVPILFRPWHENTGSWFWWGEKLCSIDDYKALWKLTESRLKEKGITNALYAYSPGTEAAGVEAKYMERYPGDACIDLLGLDTYCFGKTAEDVARYAESLDLHLNMICKIAKQHLKAAAVTETGFEGIPSDTWWSETLLPVLKKYPISYCLVWRNAHNKAGHFYAPYPGHRSAADFMKLYNDKKSLFIKEVKGLYDAPKK